MKRFHLKPDPIGDERNPFQVYLLIIAWIGGLSVVSNIPSTVGTITNYLDGSSEEIWGWLTFLGSTAVLAGMFWPGASRDGLLMKRTGLLALTISTFVYGSIIFLRFDVEGASMAFVLWGFSIACLMQARRVNKHINLAIRITKETE